MQVQFNGQNMLLPHSQTLAAFLKNHFIEQQMTGIAVALNHQIISRSEWVSKNLMDGDEIEVIHAVQGG